MNVVEIINRRFKNKERLKLFIKFLLIFKVYHNYIYNISISNWTGQLCPYNYVDGAFSWSSHNDIDWASIDYIWKDYLKKHK